MKVFQNDYPLECITTMNLNTYKIRFKTLQINNICFI